MTPAAFRHRYAEAFATFVSERSERSLRAAYELGRDAVKAELSVLEIAGAHSDALAVALADASADDVAAIATAAGDVLVETLAAYEMAQRGSSEGRRVAFVERRNARILRSLSALLADESLAAGDYESLEEILQLVAEQAREMTDACRGSVHVGALGSANAIDARSESDGYDDTWSEVLQPRERERPRPTSEGDSLHTPLLSLDGSTLGWIEVADKQSGEFTPADEALLTQVGQMTAAAVERAYAYT